MHRTRFGLILVCLAACAGETAPAPDSAPPIEFDRAGMLRHLAGDVIAPVYEQFVADADALAAAVDAYCAALGQADVETARGAAQEAWRAAMSTWQLAELAQLGPMSNQGAGLRDVIYSWPLVAPCGVDHEIVALLADPSGYDMSVKLTNRRGLDALEYVLFSNDLASSCPEQTVPDGWNELSDADRVAARCAYTAAAARDLAAQAGELLRAWPPFVDALVSDPDGVNAVFGALFYLDTRTKDDKLARPAGLAINTCGTIEQPCPADLESPFARFAKPNVAANLHAFRMLFFGETLDGVEGLGFDDFMASAGASDSADALRAGVEAAEAAITALPATMDEALAADYAGVVEAHARVREVAAALESDVAPTLGLEIPTEAGGDAD